MPGISIVKATVFTKIKGFCSQYKAVYDKLVELDDVPDSLIAKEQNKMVRQNVAYVGWADVFDDLLVLAQQYNNNGGALINWINTGTFDAVEVANGGALTFTSLEGLTGDGNAYLELNYNARTQGVNYTLNDASHGAYVRDFYFGLDNFVYGVYSTIPDGGTDNAIRLYRSTIVIPKIGVDINNDISETPLADVNGFLASSRASSAGFSWYYNKNKTDQVANSTKIPNQGIVSLARRSTDGSVGLFSQSQVSCIFFGGSLTESQENAFYDAMQAYMTSNSKEV